MFETELQIVLIVAIVIPALFAVYWFFKDSAKIKVDFKEKTDEQKLYYVLQSCLFYSQDNDVDSGTVNTINVTIMGNTKKMSKSFDLDDKSFCEVIDEMCDFVQVYRRRYEWEERE